jgi:hypothetical protein
VHFLRQQYHSQNFRQSLRHEASESRLFKAAERPCARRRRSSISLSAIVRHGRRHDELPIPSHPRPSDTHKPSLDPLEQPLVPHMAQSEHLPHRGTARGAHRHRAPSSPLAGPFPDPAEPRNRTLGERGPFPRPFSAANTGEFAGFSVDRRRPPPEDHIARPRIFLRAKPQTEGAYVRNQNL